MISFRGSLSHAQPIVLRLSRAQMPIFFWFSPPISPLFKRPESRRDAEPALSTSFKVLFVRFVFLTGKKSKALFDRIRFDFSTAVARRLKPA